MNKVPFRIGLLKAIVHGTLLYLLILIIPNSLDYLSDSYQIGDHAWAVLLMGIYQLLHHRLAHYLEKPLPREDFLMERIGVQTLMSILLGLVLATWLVYVEFHQIKVKLRETNLNSPADAFEITMNLRMYIIFVAVIFLDELITHAVQFFTMYQDKTWEAEQIRKEMIVNQLTTLKNQIQPDFWFACLKVLQKLVHQSPEKSERYIKQLSYYYRFSLNHSEKELISLREEMHFVETYWYLVQAGALGSMSLQVDIEEDDYQKLIPSKAMQKLLERLLEAWKPGEGSLLEIQIHTRGNYLHICLFTEGRPTQLDLLTLLSLDELIRIYEYYTDENVELLDNQIRLPLLELLSQKKL